MIKKEIIHILQLIYLIMIFYDIKLSINWLSFKKNWIIDILSHLNLLKLINSKLNEMFQISLKELNQSIRFLCQKFINFFKMNSSNLLK